MRIVIRQGRVIDPATGLDSQHDIFIADGLIVGIGQMEGFSADKIIDAYQHIVMPGLVDLAAHLCEPGAEHKATILSETKAAAKSGITTLCVWPDTDPIIDTAALVELIDQRAKAAGYAKIETLGALTVGLKGEQLTEMAALKAAGCVGMTNGYFPVAQTNILRHAFEYAATYDITVFITPEDNCLAGHGCIHEGSVSTRLGLPGIPDVSETIALARHLQLVEYTGVRAHFSRLTAGKSIELIKQAKDRGLPVSADVAAHQLFLSEIDILEFDSLCHVRPPLRCLKDQMQLRQALKEGVIDAICSSHQPHEQDAKLKPFPESEPGISALETLLALSLQLAEPGYSLCALLAKLTCNPAKILGLSRGRLQVGAVADICIFDSESEFTLSKESMWSQGHNTPFLNTVLKGNVVATLMNGNIVYSKNHVVCTTPSI